MYISKCRVQVKEMIKLEVIKENDSYTAYRIGDLFDDTIFKFGEVSPETLVVKQATILQLHKEAEAFGFSTEEIDLAVQNAVQFF